jgi:hypothetical protein
MDPMVEHLRDHWTLKRTLLKDVKAWSGSSLHWETLLPKHTIESLQHQMPIGPHLTT